MAIAAKWQYCFSSRIPSLSEAGQMLISSWLSGSLVTGFGEIEIPYCCATSSSGLVSTRAANRVLRELSIGATRQLTVWVHCCHSLICHCFAAAFFVATFVRSMTNPNAQPPVDGKEYYKRRKKSANDNEGTGKAARATIERGKHTYEYSADWCINLSNKE